jgi:hypothetical protein
MLRYLSTCHVEGKHETNYNSKRKKLRFSKSMTAKLSDIPFVVVSTWSYCRHYRSNSTTSTTRTAKLLNRRNFSIDNDKHLYSPNHTPPVPPMCRLTTSPIIFLLVIATKQRRWDCLAPSTQPVRLMVTSGSWGLDIYMLGYGENTVGLAREVRSKGGGLFGRGKGKEEDVLAHTSLFCSASTIRSLAC